jgi:uncharacterized membrane protein YraQ (UPF0718 family)
LGAIEDSAYPPEEIWVEWNGVTPFSVLEQLLLEPGLHKACRIQRVLHVADGGQIEELLGRTGAALPGQIAQSDFILLRRAPSPPRLRRLRGQLAALNPGIKLYGEREMTRLSNRLLTPKEQPVSLFVQAVLLLIALYYILRPLWETLQLPVNGLINVFLGIILQAIPFLVIGVLLSSAIQIFVPQRFIERHFPKSLGLGMAAAILGGFCLPVCDCASVPVFKSLVKKGIPLPAAITFMTATPIINPVVMLSTYYAFGQSLTMVLARVGLGIAAAVVIGLTFALRPPKGAVLSGGALDGVMCSCGCYEDTPAATTLREKLALFLRHAQAEFFSVGKYLIIGTAVASVFQILGTDLFTARQGAGYALSVLVMMVMAFTLSLCSSSDAVIARSFARQFPMGAIMGFLIFGPMMDIKNVLMLSSGFSKGFIARLLATAFAVCFAAALLLAGWGGV